MEFHIIPLLYTRGKTRTDILPVPYTSPSTHTGHVPKISQSLLLIQVISNPHVYIQAGDSVALPSFRVQYFFTTFNNRNHTFSDCLRIWQNAVQGKVRLLHHHIAMVTGSHVCIMNAVGVRVEPRLCPFHCPLRVACLLLPSLWSISHLFALSGLLKMNVMQCIEL